MRVTSGAVLFVSTVFFRTLQPFAWIDPFNVQHLLPGRHGYFLSILPDSVWLSRHLSLRLEPGTARTATFMSRYNKIFIVLGLTVQISSELIVHIHQLPTSYAIITP